MATTKRLPKRFVECCIIFLLLPGGVSSLGCSSLAVDSPVVLWGATVTANCTIWRNRCPFLKDEQIQMIWKLDGQHVPGVQHSPSEGVEFSSITIGPLNRTVISLGCWVSSPRKPQQQLMNLKQIHAGYPPSQPQNLTCIMNETTRNLKCQWDPGEGSPLQVHAVLKGFKSQSGCAALLVPIPDCIPKSDQNSCTIPRENLYLYQPMAFWVTVSNGLGAVQSETLCADPVDLVKLDPPTIQSIHSISEETHCVSVAWDAAKDSEYMRQSCDLRYRNEDDQEWTLVQNLTGSTRQTQHCGFLFGISYQFQMRCKKLAARYMSDWSPTKTFTTHEDSGRAPSGELDAWWKMKPREAGQEIQVQLLWKPMKPKEANGKILGYWVSLSPRQQSGQRTTVCNTMELHCNFSLPFGVQRVYLMAYNARGSSPPTEVKLQKKGIPVHKIQASSCGENSICVSWDPPGESTTGYIVEWQRMTSVDSLDDAETSWTKLRNRESKQILIQENIKPYQRYNISIYPLYRDGVGMPQHTEAYSRQKAPSDSPKLHLGSISKKTAQLHWEPIPLELRNGFLTNYTIFWVSAGEDMNCAVVNACVNTFTITGLRPLRMYKVHIMASTVGGSINGTVLMLYTKATDDIDISFTYVLILLLLFMLIVLVICFHKSKRMKMQFWPSVPDPANSSLGRWAPSFLQEETLPVNKSEELSPVTIPTILVLEKDKKCEKNSPSKALLDRPWPDASNTEMVLPPGSPMPACHVNSPESIQYAKVLPDSYHSQQEALSSLYLRSNSTQPLLGDMTPSPEPYENLWFHDDQPNRGHSCSFEEDAVFLEGALVDFPLLRGLKIDGDEDLSNF
ncbi:granulocyte colony-stimulating factor receptor [Eublepharis macularius]|uniref:Granulocyte colony-stimulating factor receptor n=1 Tax=Eublepharis macularius TaxID=481883 RepID=A0AA97LGI9_EUBMA|nr:granulocyte colony-stimulating factor receptor [Eublepharis macularius]